MKIPKSRREKETSIHGKIINWISILSLLLIGAQIVLAHLHDLKRMAVTVPSVYATNVFYWVDGTPEAVLSNPLWYDPLPKESLIWLIQTVPDERSDMAPRHYSPKSDRFLVCVPYHDAKEKGQPMTIVANQILTQALTGGEGWKKAMMQIQEKALPPKSWTPFW